MSDKRCPDKNKELEFLTEVKKLHNDICPEIRIDIDKHDNNLNNVLELLKTKSIDNLYDVEHELFYVVKYKNVYKFLTFEHEKDVVLGTW